MVCVAAFIILVILVLLWPVLRLFNKKAAAKLAKLFKKSSECVGKRVRLQKCETSFKDDIKNILLSKVVLRKPNLVKPLSRLIEVLAVVLVVVTIWSVAEVAKGGLALWTLGTCNVTQPSACEFAADVCAIETESTAWQWFKDWGVIFAAIPDRLKTWTAADYVPDVVIYHSDIDKPLAIDVLDPGCLICLQSYRNMMESGFFEEHRAVMLPYVLRNVSDGRPRYQNSELVVKYLVATAKVSGGEASWGIIDRIFAGYDAAGMPYQSVINMTEADEVAKLIAKWLGEMGLNQEKITEIKVLVDSEEIEQAITEMRHIVEEKIQARGVPTMIYGGKRHMGLFQR